jgi:TetR/AcrR family transcriptional regulator, regulator of autoinduction and epiphytic fitness
VTTARSEEDPRIERSRRVVREAALQELAEVGYGAFTIDSVAGRCGVARSTIYRHWPDKATLIFDAFETLNQQPPPLDAALGESARQRIHRLLRHLAEVFRDSIFSACVPSLIEGAERHSDVRRFHHQFSDRRRQALVDAIAQGIATGEISPRVDPELAAIALGGAIIYRRVMTGERFDPERVSDLMDTVLGEPPSSHPRPQRTGSRRIPRNRGGHPARGA